MTDIVERLRDQGKDAFSKHYSLGMFKLCDEAAGEIERLRNALEPFSKLRPVSIGFAAAFQKPDWADCDWAVGFDGLQPEFRYFEKARDALSPLSSQEGKTP